MALGYVFQIFLRIAIQNQISVAQGVIVDEIIEAPTLGSTFVSESVPELLNVDFVVPYVSVIPWSRSVLLSQIWMLTLQISLRSDRNVL